MTPREQQRANRIVWFEIPVQDMDRAVRFYETVLETKLKREQAGPTPIAIFTYDPPFVSGCLAKDEKLQPSAQGSLVYLNADPNLDSALERAKANGGQVVTPRTPLPGLGFYASIRDTEGNTVGLHAIS
ncbi:MAG TPA: VOC family protein [Verrucomicrobiae bacterium]|nr:VOC family protein [Verrucomicrobiae bacterium]